MSKPDKARIIQDYELAFEAANSGRRTTVVETSPGWFTMKSDDRMPWRKLRLTALVEMTKNLQARIERDDPSKEA